MVSSSCLPRELLPPATGDLQPDAAPFGAVLILTDHTAPTTVQAGHNIYVNLTWEARPDLATLPVSLNMSLRLYDAAGNLVTQADEPTVPPTTAWSPDDPINQSLVLPVPASTEPGEYSLELVAYRSDTGEPLPLPDGSRTVLGQRWQLGTVETLRECRRRSRP